MELDLTKLNQLLAIARTGSFSRAAEELQVTQPALSRTVAGIEQRFGFRLFDRGRGGVTPTAAGALVLEDAKLIVRDAKLLEDNMRLYSRGDAGRVAFGMGPLLASLFLPRLGLHAFETRPNLQLRCSIKPADVLLRELLSDEIEMLFCAGEQVAPSPDLLHQQVGAIDLAMFARADHPLAAAAQLRMADLRPFPYACAVELQSQQFPGRGGALICDNYEILREVVLGGDAVWLSSPQMAARDLDEQRLVRLSIADLPVGRSHVVMVRLKRRTCSPAAAAIIAHVEQLLAADEGPR
jgi:DNA-binding transcriptional LysR family regulator